MSETVADRPYEPVKYGNWGKPTSRGLLGMGTAPTMVLVVGACLMMLGFMANNLAVVGLIIVATLGATALMVVKDQYGQPLVSRIAAKTGFQAQKRLGENLYASGPLARHGFGKHRLPGVLAATELTSAVDPYGRRFAMLSLGRHKYSTVIECYPDGNALIDARTVDERVARFAAFLSNLADEPDLVAAQITVESAPDSGVSLRTAVTGSMAADAPQLARQVMDEVVSMSTSNGVRVSAWVTLTFESKLPAADFHRDLATRLPSFTEGLKGTGAGRCRPCDETDLCRIARVAYDPACAPTVEQAMNEEDKKTGLAWDDVGPTYYISQPTYLEHDSGITMTWESTMPPQSAVTAKIFSRLLAPHRDIPRKRVSILFRVIPRNLSPRAVESNLSAAIQQTNAKTKVSERDRVRAAKAAANAAEEAAGAALIDFSMMVSATVLGDKDEQTTAEAVNKAKTAIDSLRASSRLQLRLCRGAQDTAFAMNLPFGIILDDLLLISRGVREKM